MDEEVKKYVDKLFDEKTQFEHRNLYSLVDLIKFGSWEDEDIQKISARLIFLLSTEPDLETKLVLLSCLQEAFFSDVVYDLAEVSFEPLIKAIKNSKDPNFIGSGLYALSFSYSKLHRLFVESYLSYPDEAVQNEVKDVLTRLKY